MFINYRWAGRTVSVFLAALVVVAASAYPGDGFAGPVFQSAPALGTAQAFAVLASASVSNTGVSLITGDLGVSPGSAVTGFPPGTVSGGTIHINDGAAQQAQIDVTTAYTALDQPCDVDLTGQDLGGLTLSPGVYCFASSAQLTGTLTLDGQNLANPVFIFKTGSSLTTASGASVALTRAASACNVYWRIGSSATLGTTTTFSGSILALASITLATNTNLAGRALARTGAVTLDTNVVSTGACGAALPPTSTATATSTIVPPTGTAGVATATAAAAATGTAAAATATAGAGTATAVAGTATAGAPATGTALVATSTAAVATATAGAAATATANALLPATPVPNDDNDNRRETPEQRQQRQRTNKGNQDDYATEGNVTLVACAQVATATATSTLTVTPTPTTMATATFTVTPTVTSTLVVPIQVPRADDLDPDEAFSADARAMLSVMANDRDADDMPYVVIGTRDGDQRVRLRREARASCSSIRVGDYLEAEGEKQHELLFDADDVTIKRAGRKVK